MNLDQIWLATPYEIALYVKAGGLRQRRLHELFAWHAVCIHNFFAKKAIRKISVLLPPVDADGREKKIFTASMFGGSALAMKKHVDALILAKQNRSADDG